MPTSRIYNLDPTKLRGIMQSAVREFSQFEYSQSSFNRIIRNSGLSKGTIYYYFESKEDIFLIILKNCIHQLKKIVVPKTVYKDPKEYWDESEKLLTCIFEYFGTDPALGQFLQRNIINPEKAPASPGISYLCHIDDWLHEFLIIGQNCGAVRQDLPVEFLGSLAWSVWQTGVEWRSKGADWQDKEYALESAAIIADNFRRILQ